ncbi:CPBP family glutamic-type intramembrane protease [Parapusillimonas granuli]|uniref:CPBP family intramembrane metalloprotease n=1 Tax=Parapusillimonas granuli TaxID=380911 RepID=A0A853FUB6_9BURK|nr:CPBP family glutamic-type intramembrane protease [Parapusillimonas granuli]MEB2398437.1 CPBP family glutamic-type intramembrane protease [Alcaligenaceae bacterium]NYT49545.1 CPBP family intramembrane metalloprotease [Parapusillimonas granuli]
MRFRDELRDFFRFLRRPGFTPRLPGRKAGDGWVEDWFPALSVGRLLKWALFLWLVNLIFLGPIAVAAAGVGGATHRLSLDHLPWLQALLWAPIVEELVFRYGLRRLGQAWWLVPAAVAAMFMGPKWPGVLMLAGIVAVCWLPYLAAPPGTCRPLPWRYRQAYRGVFPWVFHLGSMLFAAVHLYNFNLHQTPPWLLPLLVLPQWLTGLVLGWLRVRRGIGASMLLHALFNGGPLLVVWLVIQAAPDLVK